MQEKKFYLVAQFDKKTHNKLAGYYDILRKNSLIGSQTKDIPYHFTLGSHDYAAGIEKKLTNDLERICSETSCIDIHLSHIGLFSQRVLFVAPSMNFELLKLQQSFFPNCGNGSHLWTAHATLLIDEPEAILKAIPIAAKEFNPFKAQIESVALYEFFPQRLIKERRLA